MERNTYDAFVQPYADMVREREATYQSDANLKQFFERKYRELLHGCGSTRGLEKLWVWILKWK